MPKELPNLHDAELLDFAVDSLTATARIVFKFEQEPALTLKFGQVKRAEFLNYRRQNVVFTAHLFQGATGESPAFERACELIGFRPEFAHSEVLFFAEPSVGAEVAILARTFELITDGA